MIPPIIHELEARSALNPVQGMPFKWSLNPYKGCGHACGYCYARAYHSFLDLPPSSFETQLFAKLNVAEVLRAELRKPTWEWEYVAVGTATDPYQPIEGQYRLTRKCLEALAEVDNPGSVTTKGALVTRDIDVLSDLARRTDFSVNVSLVCLDRELLRKLEPGAPTPATRLRMMERLSQAGVPVSLSLSPVLPGLTDQPESVAETVRAAAEHGASDVWAGALRLAPGVKEHFMEIVEREFAHLQAGYRRLYGPNTHAPTPYQLQVEGRVSAARRAEGLAAAAPRGESEPRKRQPQLALF